MEKNNTDHYKLMEALQAAGELAYVWNTKTDDIEWLGDFNRFSKRESADVPRSKSDLNILIHSGDLVERARDLRSYLNDEDNHAVGFDNEFRLKDQSGHEFWVHDSAKGLISDENNDMYMYGVLRRLQAKTTSRKSLNNSLKRDRLTGYLKRNAFNEEIEKLDRDGVSEHISKDVICVVGIDRLSIYNEAFGADITNNIIKAVGLHLEKCLNGRNALLSRIGGDRFALYVQDVSSHDMSVCASTVLASLSTVPLMTPEGPVRVSVSIGSARYPVKGCSVSDVLARAEAALQIAKDQGRGCYVPYTISAREQSQYRKWLQTGDDLVLALNGNRIVLAYQPIVDSKTSEVVLHECLVRMISADGDLISAADFIPAVEHLGLSRIIDKFVLKQSVKELIENPRQTFSVNVSGYTISDESWMRSLVSLLKAHPQAAKRLVIEITESVAIDDSIKAKEFVKTIQAMGGRVALDDFGAGYTSFSQIQQLGVDIIKIDKSFIRNMANSENDRIFVQALHRIANSHDILTIGEGVETLEDAELLRKEGIDLFQGYAFGFPKINNDWNADVVDVTEIVAKHVQKI